MPLQRNISPHKGAPCLRPFDIDQFLKTVDQSGPQLTSGLKGDWVGLYRSVIGSHDVHVYSRCVLSFLVRANMELFRELFRECGLHNI